METLQSPLQLPRSLQELILAKLPLQDLLRSRAVCKLWRRFSSTKSFRKRYERLPTKPWLLILKLPEFIATRGNQVPLPSSRLYAGSQVVSTSAGLLLLMYKTGRFAVLNPITLDVKYLPALDVTAESQNIVYSGILCSDASSYKVVVIGLMEADKLCSRSVNVSVEYMQPFMRVYSSSSKSEEWTSITNFPPGFLRSESHQIFISKGVLYCTINGADEELDAGKIARFDMSKLQWNPRLMQLPEKLLLISYIGDVVDEGGELVVMMTDQENRSFIMSASIERDKLVVKSLERFLPKEIHQTDLSFKLLGAFGKAVCLHVPVEADGVDSLPNWEGSVTVQNFCGEVDKEPQKHSFLFDMKEGRLELNENFILPLGMVVLEMVNYVKLPFYPSLRVP